VQNLSSPVAPELASLTFSSTSATADYAEIAGMLTHAGTPLCLGSALQVPGRYNRENLLCAAALTDATPDAVRTVAEQFRGVEHRMEYVGCYGGVACYNSSIDTTPTRTAATLSALEHPCTVICGGSDKGLTVAPLTEALLAHAARVVFTGACGERMRDALLAAPAYAGTPGTCYLRDFEEAVHAALNMTPPSGTLVLSPAAASFDTFRSFEERGEAFRRLVREGRTKQPPHLPQTSEQVPQPKLQKTEDTKTERTKIKE
jgi:UDP-N-acetylmuramoylalanine--D-glutamate ligase